MQFEIVITVVSVVWLSGLSVLIFLMWKKLGKLTGGVDGRNLLNVIEQVLDTEKANSTEIKKIKKEIEKINNLDLLHIQKTGLVRFNPFNEMGGDHSFTLALLDGHDNGFIITGLHTRERTRVYIKPVKAGRSSLELSKEEKKALVIALENTA
jgi:hypothetical protein